MGLGLAQPAEVGNVRPGLQRTPLEVGLHPGGTRTRLARKHAVNRSPTIVIGYRREDLVISILHLVIC